MDKEKKRQYNLRYREKQKLKKEQPIKESVKESVKDEPKNIEKVIEKVEKIHVEEDNAITDEELSDDEDYTTDEYIQQLIQENEELKKLTKQKHGKKKVNFQEPTQTNYMDTVKSVLITTSIPIVIKLFFQNLDKLIPKSQQESKKNSQSDSIMSQNYQF